MEEGRVGYTPVKRRGTKAGRTNRFGLKTNRWYEVRKEGGWVGKYEKVSKGWETEQERLEEYGKKERLWEVEEVRRKNTGKKKTSKASIRKEVPREKEVRELGPRMRKGVRMWGKAKRENGRPGEKRVMRSRSETRSVRGDGVRMKAGKGKEVWSKQSREKAEVGRWNEVRVMESDMEKYSRNDVRETREATKRLAERREKGDKSRKRKNQRGRHKRRMEREDKERVGGKELVEKVWERLGERRTGRGVGEGMEMEGAGRKARQEVKKRGEHWERSRWDRNETRRDVRGVEKRIPLQRRGVWRNKEKRVISNWRKEREGARVAGKQAARREAVGRREQGEKKGYKKREGKEREEYEKRKRRESGRMEVLHME